LTCGFLLAEALTAAEYKTVGKCLERRRDGFWASDAEVIDGREHA